MRDLETEATQTTGIARVARLRRLRSAWKSLSGATDSVEVPKDTTTPLQGALREVQRVERMLGEEMQGEERLHWLNRSQASIEFD